MLEHRPETTAEERARWARLAASSLGEVSSLGMAAARLLRDFDRQSAEIARLTVELAAVVTDARADVEKAKKERDYHRTAHDSAVARIAQLTKSLAEARGGEPPEQANPPYPREWDDPK